MPSPAAASAVPGEPVALTRVRRLRADRARQVADVLRAQILRGDYPHRTLPDERALMLEFGESRNTVRDALDLLRCDGLVERQQGVGTLVTAKKYAHGLNRLMGLAETLREHGPITNEVRTAGPITPPRVVAQRLGVPAGEQVIYIERLRRLSGLPLSLDLTYLPSDVGAQLLAEDLVNEDVFALIERTSGRALGTAEIEMEAVNADPHSADVLEIPRGAAMLLLERLSHFDDGRPVDLEYIRFRGDRLTMRAEMRRA